MTTAATTKAGTDGAFSAEELAAMKAHAAEVKASRGRTGKKGKEEDLHALLEKIEGMGESDRAMARKVHEIVTAAAPELDPKLWYGMPSYARNGKSVVFFQDAAKFTSRYAMLGFQDQAALDDGPMWPVYYALARMDAEVEKRITALVRRAVG